MLFVYLKNVRVLYVRRILEHCDTMLFFSIFYSMFLIYCVVIYSY